MSGSILDMIGLGGIDIGYFIIVIAALLVISIVITIVFIVKEEKLRKRYNKFMQGKEAKSLEDEIARLYDDNKEIKEAVGTNKKEIKKLYKKFTKAVQKIGIVKYDAYQQMGGMLSFSLCMLDENNDGFILNSVHSTEGCYTYTKAIKDGECEIELGNEEKVALEHAIQK